MESNSLCARIEADQVAPVRWADKATNLMKYRSTVLVCSTFPIMILSTFN